MLNPDNLEIKNKLTLGQMKRINRSFGLSLEQNEIPDLTTLTTDEIIKIKPSIEKTIKFNDTQLELVAEIIKHSLALTDEELENIPFEQVEKIYNKILESNQPKKKFQEQYA